MDHERHCAETFYIEPGTCFAWLLSAKPGSQGSPTHCPKPVEFQGKFQDGTGKWHKAWAASTKPLTYRKGVAVSANIPDISDAPRSPFRRRGASHQLVVEHKWLDVDEFARFVDAESSLLASRSKTGEARSDPLMNLTGCIAPSHSDCGRNRPTASGAKPVIGHGLSVGHLELGLVHRMKSPCAPRRVPLDG